MSVTDRNTFRGSYIAMGIADEYLVGRKLESIERFGFSWQFQFGSGITLTVEAGWRFVTDEGIEVTSEDDGQKFGLPAPVEAAALGMSVVRDKSVTEVQITPYADLIISF